MSLASELAVVRFAIRGMQMQNAPCVTRRVSVRPLLAVLVSAVALLPSARAQTFTTVHTFLGPDGAYPFAGLAQAAAGGYVGATRGGGANNGGVVFVLVADGSATTLYSFCAAAQCTDGSQPVGGLVQGTDGDLYGTTYAGGASGDGTVFKLTSGGVLSTLHSFAGSDGASPNAGLIHAADGDFYGTTSDGGAKGYGTVFSITSGGAFTTLHSFVGSDGAHPNAALLQAADGSFYGTTAGGGIGDNGTVFRIVGGVLTTLHRFQGMDGSHPESALISAYDGDFYATTVDGGSLGYGTVFRLTRTGQYSTVHDFTFTDGAHPYAGLVQPPDLNFYGTTVGGGELEYGTVFKLTPQGVITTLHGFCSQFLCPDGSLPYDALFEATDGNLYGTTKLGGARDGNEVDVGTVFALSVGLSPFVETQPTAGTIGTAVRILGDNLTGATQVFFNDQPSGFTVVSASEIITVVPSGAATGVVEVVTPSGVLGTNINFTVY
jgi:uncharacterized repeat protein (TIGR03803 family)